MNYFLLLITLILCTKKLNFLIKKGKAYVCDLTPEEMKDYRGSLTAPGKESPYRNRSVLKKT